MTLVKDTLENLASVVSAPVNQPPAPNSAEPGGLRADAVSLEVPLKVHGSHVSQDSGGALQSEPFEEVTSTMIVFPQGGVVKMSTAVNVGQMVVVTNLKSGQDSICRVVKVRAYANTQSYVEVEFTHRQVGYWGVQFASDALETPKKPSLSAVPRVPAAPPAAFEAVAPQVKPAPVSKVPAPGSETSKERSTFVTFGAQEDVQLAASLTAQARHTAAKPMSAGPSDVRTSAIEPSKQAAPPISSLASSHHSLPVEELRGGAKAPTPHSGDSSGDAPASSREAVLILEDSPALDSSPTPEPAPAIRGFGESTNLGGVASAASTESRNTVNEGRGSKPLVLSAVAVALLALAGAGGYFFLQHRSDLPSASVQPIASSPASPAVATSSPQLAMQASANIVSPAATSRSDGAPRVTPPTPKAHASDATKQPARSGVSGPAASSVAPVAEAPQAAPVAPEQRHFSGNAPSLFGALNAHPVAAHSATRETEAPVLPAAVGDGLGVISQPIVAPPAPHARTTMPPIVISSVLPIYPDFARQRGVDGAVVVQATVEPNGTVGAMKVLSGPLPLREAALQAVRQWKFQPGKIDGEKAAVDTTLTLRFNSK